MVYRIIRKERKRNFGKRGEYEKIAIMRWKNKNGKGRVRWDLKNELVGLGKK
jgi:hypothetical protein